VSDFFKRASGKVRRIALAKTARFRSTIPTAIAGAGRISPTHIDGYFETGYCHPIAVFDPNISALGELMGRYELVQGFIDPNLMFESAKPQIVSICTWPQAHLDVVKQAVDAGAKGVLCEKPLTLRLDEAIAMKQYCDSNNVKLAGAHQYRFSDPFRILRKAIANNSLGKIKSIRGCIQSTVANNGPHLIDAIRFILGDRPLLRIRCKMERARMEENRGYPAEDSSSSQLIFDGDVNVQLDMGDAAWDFFKVEIQSDRGLVSLSPKGIESSIPLEKPNPNPKHAHPRMFKEFVEWVLGKRPEFAASADQSLLSVEAMLAHYEAAKSDQWLELPLINHGDLIKELYPSIPENTPPSSVRNPPAIVEGLKPRSDRSLAVDGQSKSVNKWFTVKATVGKKEVDRVAKVVATGQMSSTAGSEVKKLEASMSKMYKVPGAVASTSGTSALHVALATWNPDAGSEIITTPITDMGSIIPILACNCIPVFADIDPLTGNMTAETIAAKITDKTRAVILVHLFGRPANVHAIQKLLKERNIALIEDCSQAHYADVAGGKIGSVGDFGCFSFQQSKQITCGDGGITLINRPELLKRAQLFIDKGWDRSGGGRAHLFLGMNYRMTEMQGAVANVQLERLPGLIEGRRKTADALSSKLRNIEGIQLPTECSGARSSWWIYHFIFEASKYILNTENVCGLLSSEGIKCKNGYLPRPMFQETVLTQRQTYGNSGYPLTHYGYVDPKPQDYPGTIEFLRDSILIGWAPNIPEKTIDQIAVGLERVMKSLRTR
jgi:dTDP-4-amino-4,6-dideoxygalactose transaminase/predicted dehydrogenase